MDSSAFSRVGSFLRYARPARWTAVLCGIATAILYALLILLLALFADLLVTRGRIPNFAQLPARDQQGVQREWLALPDEDRERAIQHLGFGEFQVPPAKGEAMSPEAAARLRVYRELVGFEGSDFPPIPGQTTSEQLLDWAKRNEIAGDPYYAAATENELRCAHTYGTCWIDGLVPKQPTDGNPRSSRIRRSFRRESARIIRGLTGFLDWSFVNATRSGDMPPRPSRPSRDGPGGGMIRIALISRACSSLD